MARLSVILVGTACFVVFLATASAEALFIGLGMAGTFLVIPTVIGCFLVPSHKARLILGPMLLSAWCSQFSSGPSTSGPFNVSAMFLILSLMALAMAMPEVPAMKRFYAQLFRNHP